MSIPCSWWIPLAACLLVVAPSKLFVPTAARGAETDGLQLRLEPACKVASPGLGAVVNVTIVNGSDQVFDAPDLWGDAFWSTAWRWTWKSDDLSYRITERDVSYGSIPSPAFIPPIRIVSRGQRQWVAVIPIPDAFGGKSVATLTCDFAVRQKARLSADAEFILAEHVSPAFVQGVDSRFVRSAISTGMQTMAWDGCRTADAKAALSKQAFAGEDALLLAWFCASLGDKGRIDEQAWIRLNASSGDTRAIRDANLFRALATGQVRLSKGQADGVIKHVKASYSFSDAMVAAAITSTKK